MSRILPKTAFTAGAIVGAYSLMVAALYWRQRDLLYRAPRKTQSMDIPKSVAAQSPSNFDARP